MGKVGSTSILRTLKSTRYAQGAQHLHFLNPETLPTIHDIHRMAGFKEAPAHLKATESFNEVRSAIDPDRLFVIMAVRDPVAFAISDFFQNPYFFKDFDLELTERNAAQIERYLRDVVLAPTSSSFRYWNEWLSKEMEDVFDFRFSDHQFDQLKGWAVLDCDQAKIGCIQLETMSDEFQNFTLALLGERIPLNGRIANQRSNQQKFYGQLIQRLSLSRGHLEQIYASSRVRYFYSDEQIERFMQRWQK
jgi:hypothetical protein